MKKDGPGMGIFLVCLLAMLLISSFSAHRWRLFPGDLEISLFLQSMSIPGLDAVMRGVSVLGEQSIALALIVGLAIPLWARGYKRGCLLLVST